MGLTSIQMLLARLGAQMAKTYRALPIEFKADTNELVVAVDKADNFRATDDLARCWE